MQLSAFTLDDPVPALNEPHALASLRPWVDVGSVGTLALNDVARVLDAQPLGRLTRPGRFFDFTRYRPTAYFKEGLREVEPPNSMAQYARRPGKSDLILLHLLEPHANGEDYVEALLALLQHFSVKRYFLVGSMYDMVPHTRPLLISGSASDLGTRDTFAKHGVGTSRYEGPTTILTLLAREAARVGIDTMSLVVRLPQYAPIEEDQSGRLRLLELLSDLYELPLDLAETRDKAEEQLRQVSAAVEANPQLRRVIHHLEERYEVQAREAQTDESAPPLPPAIEEFLRGLDT